ncbi:MAG: DUF1569 domain-containing protein [Acidobacteria bacterium]|nr:DUF1569 domain-containing protein [Acidobacteriota bacterium]
MYPQGSLTTPGTLEALVSRLESVRPDSARQWGRMTPSQMVCHLSDSFLTVTGQRPIAKHAETFFTRTVIKYVAIHSPMPWPKGVPTMKEVDAEQEGTRPGEFERDRQRTIELMRAFAAPDASCVRHPIFGEMSRAEWMKWGFGHVDHHLRQFGC